jgi:tetratricopeptide (TPR) repeat protein
LGVPLFVLTAAAAHVAMKPPLFEAEFEEGIRQSHQGQPKEAAQHFIASAEANPKYLPARFNLGLSRLAVGQFDSAIEDFARLAEEHGDVPSMAYVGYVFNLKGVPIAAIPWYEMAIRNGDSTLATLNNLGASLIDTQTQDSTSERYRRSQAYLDQAIELDPACEAVRLNALRLTLERSNGAAICDVDSGFVHAEALLDRAQRDDHVKALVAMWYYKARKTHSATLKPDSRWQLIVDAADKLENGIAKLNAGKVQSQDFSDLAGAWTSGSRGALASLFFIEPVLREERR